jgi:hemerythrin
VRAALHERIGLAGARSRLNEFRKFWSDGNEVASMGLTHWRNEYSLGIDEIDEQHKVLVNCISSLETSIEDPDEKQRWAAIHYAIVQLSDYTRIHFTVEESVMRILGYPGLDAHIEQHRVFVSYLKDVERKSITHDVREDEIVSFLRKWLLTHIVNEDRQYANFFAAARGKNSRPGG